jgi:hypothetical protein
MELSTSVPGGSSRRGSVFGALARRAWNITPVVPGEISRPTDITGTHTRTTMLVERQNKTDREKKIELQENVEAAEDRVRDLRRRRAIESVEAANDALQARPDLIEEWEAGAAAAELSPTSASRAHGGTRAARGRGGGSNAAEPPTPSDVQERFLSNLVDNEFMWPGVPEDLTSDRAFMLKAVAANGRALEFASAALKEDRELVMAAVGQSGIALKHSSAKFKNDREICLEAVSQHGEALEFASDELRGNGWFVTEATKRDFRSWPFTLDLEREIVLASKRTLVRARQEMARQHTSLPPEEQIVREYNGGFYTPYYGHLNAALVDNSTALVYASYLVAVDDRKEVLQHRANLPDEAFYYGPIWSEYDGQYGSGILVVAVSYLWATSEHPDPKGEHLRDLAQFLRWLMRSDRCKRTKVVVFMDWVSLYMDHPLGSRTPEHTEAFEAGLANVQKWYAHPNSLTLLAKKKAKTREWPFNESGWPVFERAVSNMAKAKDHVLDLGAIVTWLGDRSVEGQFTDEYGVPVETRCCYEKLVEAGSTESPLLPSTVERFGAALRRLHFAVPSDADLLRAKYAGLFGELTAKIQRLVFHRMGPPTSSEDWGEFVRCVLPRCTGVEVLNLSGNRSLSVSIVDIVSCCPGTLRELCVDDTSCVGDGPAAGWRKLPYLQSVSLVRSLIAGSQEELEAVLPEGCVIRPGLGAKNLEYRRHGFTRAQWAAFTADILPLCKGLEWLRLDDNPQLEVDIEELVGNLPATLKELSLSHTGVNGFGLKAPWSKLPQLYLLNMDGTNVMGAKEELLGLLPYGCQVTPGLGAKQLFLNGKNLALDEWRAFLTTTLPKCVGLEELYLDDNPALAVDIAVVVENCPHTLLKLSVDNTALFGDGEAVAWGAVGALEVLSLRGNPGLAMNIVRAVETLPASLKELFLRDTNCYGVGVDAPWARLENLEWVHIDGSKITGTEDELEAVLPDGCYAFVDKQDSAALPPTSLLPSC